MATFTRRKKLADIYVYITEREPHRAELPRWKVSQQEGYFVGKKIIDLTILRCDAYALLAALSESNTLPQPFFFFSFFHI